MGLIPDQSHLTVTDHDFEAKRRGSWPGMAHFAGTGPIPKTCRECAEWTGCGIESGYYAKRGVKGGGLKPRPCAKHRSLMRGDVGPGVPHDARSCKYFRETQNPPPLAQKSS